jgi:hypothetical protein
MASAKSVGQPDVVLTLTADEAATLLKVMNNVSGDMQRSRRRHTEAIAAALKGVGVSAAGLRINGAVDFNNDKESV